MGAVGQLAARLHEVKAEVAVLFVEPLQRPLGEEAERRVGHIDEVAVLVFAVHTVQPDAVHLGVAAAERLILAVSIVCVPEIELQRVVVILAKIHQRVHLLVGHGMLGDDGAVSVHDAGTVAGDGVVEPDAAQLAFPVDGRPRPAGAQHELSPGGLKLLHGLDYRRAGLALTEEDEGVVIIACENLVLHGVLLTILLYELSISQNGGFVSRICR